MADGPLAGLRVIELTDDTGRFAGKLLAESGASVAQREADGFSGPAMRRLRPRPRAAGCSTGGTTAASTASALDLDTDGRSRRLPRPGRARRPRHRDRGAGAPGRAGHRPRRPRRRPTRRSCRCRSRRSAAPGPRADWQTSDLVAGAMCGVLSISGTPDQAIGAWGRQNLNFGSLMACICGLAGVYVGPRDRHRPARRPLAARGDDVVDREPVLPVVVPRPPAHPQAGAAPGIAPLDRRLRRRQRQARAPCNIAPVPQPALLFEWMAEEGDPEGAELSKMTLEEALGRDAPGDERDQALLPSRRTPASCSTRPSGATSPSARCRPSPRWRRTRSTSSASSFRPVEGFERRAHARARSPASTARRRRRRSRRRRPAADVDDVARRVGPRRAAAGRRPPSGATTVRRRRASRSRASRIVDFTWVLAGPFAQPHPRRPRRRRAQVPDGRAGDAGQLARLPVLLRVEPLQAARVARHEAARGASPSSARSSSSPTC